MNRIISNRGVLSTLSRTPLVNSKVLSSESTNFGFKQVKIEEKQGKGKDF